MKGNEKIAFTAEAVCFMRNYNKTDRYSQYFLTEKINRKFKIISKIIPYSYLQSIFFKRIRLSFELDKFIREYRPEQIIELACGYSTRGLLKSLKNKKLIYVEIDFPSVIKRKKMVLKEIEKKEKLNLSKNHHLIEIDVIGDNLYEKLFKIMDKNKKTLIISETLTNYLDNKEHQKLVKDILKILRITKKGAYLSHEGNKMLKGIFGKSLILYRNYISKTKSFSHFKNSKEIRNYFEDAGFSKVKTKDCKEISNIIYIAER